MRRRYNNTQVNKHNRDKLNKRTIKLLKKDNMGQPDLRSVNFSDEKIEIRTTRKETFPKVAESKIVTKKSKTKAKMIITDLFLDKVKFLCSKINAVEWSGILFYKYTGHISDPSTFVITPVDILLMDKGSQAATSFEITPEVLDIYDLRPELEEAKMGMIHSHNSMGKHFL